MGPHADRHEGLFPRSRADRRRLFDGWFVTGDLGRRDDDGYFWFVARMKDIIRKRGENIAGAEIDRVVEPSRGCCRPRRSRCRTISARMKSWSRRAAESGRRARGDRRVVPRAARRIKVPRYVVFVDALPCTPTHRVEKFKLKGDKTLVARATDLAPWSTLRAAAPASLAANIVRTPMDRPAYRACGACGVWSRHPAPTPTRCRTSWPRSSRSCARARGRSSRTETGSVERVVPRRVTSAGSAQDCG